jgi:undecaprenyl-phosphate 4-deoxy-4-formamido-L-arabinose transferase
MLRAYSRELVDLIVQSNESVTFIPALAALYARNPTEVAVGNSARAAGESKYSLLRLIQLNFDLVTGFTAAPLQMFSLFGFLVSAFSGGLVVVMAVRRLVVGPEVEGVFTLIGILFFLVGVCITGIGIMGEYLARIYQQVRGRPAYVIRRVHDVIDREP